MSVYSLSKRIKSAFVSVTLLQEIEKYILDQAEKQRQDDSQIKYSVTIYDKFGAEIIDSFRDYHRTTLPNETNRIVLDARDYYNSFRIALSFGRENSYSKLTIDIVGQSAKEKANGIASSIESQLNEHKNLNFIFHNWIAPVMTGLLFGSLMFTGYSIDSDMDISALIGLVIALTSVFYFCLKPVNPYTVFDTIKNRQISSAIKWILNGLAGVFLFGLLATFIRKYLTGF